MQKVSVIVPVYNGEDTIRNCLQTLLNQSFEKDDYEIIVVDDGSTDGTEDIVKEFDVKYIKQENLGPAAARNNGVNHATGEIVLFTDADCSADSKWIEEMMKPFDENEIVGVKGAYKTRQRELVARFAQAEFEDRYDLLKRSPSIDMVDTYSAAFRKSVFLNIGGFDESFPVANNEDTDLSYRLASVGHKLVFNPGAIVYHTHPDTLLNYLKVKFWRGYWRMVVYRRYPDKAIKDSYTPPIIKIQAMLMALSLPFIFLSCFASNIFHFSLLCWSIIFILSIHFSLKAFRQDRLVGLVSPVVIMLRSLVFAVGGFLGVARCLFR